LRLPQAAAATPYSYGRELIPLFLAALLMFAGRARKQP
jgi:hypothetical protein